MKTSKSPLEIAHWAFAIGKASLPDYSHAKSPHKYTQPQIFALLVLKQFFQEDYRGIAIVVGDFSELRSALQLTTVPHFTTLQKAARRLLVSDQAQKLLHATITTAREADILADQSNLSAMDSTGLESGHTSRYFIQRRERGEKDLYQTTTYKRFPKLALSCDCATHFITGLLTGGGPAPDVKHFCSLLRQAHGHLPIRTVTADAGYDSETNHRYAREELGVYTLINPKIGRPTEKLPSGQYRREMVKDFDRQMYGQRWQAETVISMLKRNFSEALTAKKFGSQCREMHLKVLTHNIALLSSGLWCWLQRRYLRDY